MKKVLLFLLLICGSLHGARVFKPPKMLFFEDFHRVDTKDTDKEWYELAKQYSKKEVNGRKVNKKLDLLDLSETRISLEQLALICGCFDEIVAINLSKCRLISEVKKGQLLKAIEGKGVSSLILSDAKISTIVLDKSGKFKKAVSEYPQKKILLQDIDEIKTLKGLTVAGFIDDELMGELKTVKKQIEALDVSRCSEYTFSDIGAFENLKTLIATDMEFKSTYNLNNINKGLQSLNFSRCTGLGNFSDFFKVRNMLEHLTLDDSDVNADMLKRLMNAKHTGVLYLTSLRAYNTDIPLKDFIDTLKILQDKNLTSCLNVLHYKPKKGHLTRAEVSKLFEFFSEFAYLNDIKIPYLFSGINLKSWKDKFKDLKSVYFDKVAIGRAGYNFDGLGYLSKSVKYLTFKADTKSPEWGRYLKNITYRQWFVEKPDSFEDFLALKGLTVVGMENFGDALIKTLPIVEQTLMGGSLGITNLAVIHCEDISYKELKRLKTLRSLTIHSKKHFKENALEIPSSIINLKQLKKISLDEIKENYTSFKPTLYNISIPFNWNLEHSVIKNLVNRKTMTTISDGQKTWYCGWSRAFEGETELGFKFERIHGVHTILKTYFPGSGKIIWKIDGPWKTEERNIQKTYYVGLRLKEGKSEKEATGEMIGILGTEAKSISYFNKAVWQKFGVRPGEKPPRF